MNDFLRQLSDSHRMLLKLVRAQPTDYTIAERQRILAACEDVQELIDELME